MGILQWKIRISVLWIFMAVAMAAHSVLAFMEPGAMEQIEEMPISAGMFLFMALFWWVPLVMAVLSVTLKDLANRWTNIILGIVFTALNIFHLIEHLADPSAHQILIIGSTVVVTALIFWHALKWPKQEA
jgi:hypothetical protein